MRFILGFFASIAGLFSLLFLATAVLKGTDIQLIASGVFGTMFAVCLGCGTLIAKLDELKGK